MKLRTSLLMLSAATAMPLAAAFLFATAYVAHREAEVFQQSALLRNRASVAAIDAELRGSINTLHGLAIGLHSDDLAVIDSALRAALAVQPHWQNLVLQWSDGRQIANARVPFGSALPEKLIETRSFNQAVNQARPSISDITFAPLLNNEPGVAVRVPIVIDGTVIKVLTAVLKPSAFQDILQSAELPPGWITGLVGTDGRMIARVPAVPPGTMASAVFREKTVQASEGWYRGLTLEGHDTYTAFSRSSLSGWTMGYAIPAGLILRVRDRSVALLVAGLALSMAGGLFLAYRLTRRIADPIAALANAAAHLGTERLRLTTDAPIDEVAQLADSLAQAHRAIEERDAELMLRGEKLSEQADELRLVDSNRTTLLALIAHELRNPLAPLRTSLAVLRSEHVDAGAQVRAMAIMERQIALLARLVDDLNDAGRIGRGQLELRLTAVRLNDIVIASIEACQPQWSAKDQTLVRRIADASLWICADADRMQQVFVNLLSNAHRYTPESGCIQIELRADGDHAICSVTDTGIGFSGADRDRLFGMYVQLGDEKNRPSASLGIGLAVSRAIVELHEGHITAESPGPGLGATFTVTLRRSAPGGPCGAADSKDGGI